MTMTRTPSHNRAWQHLTRLKRRLADRQELVVLAGIPFDNPALASIALGWQTTIGGSVTFDLAAGTTVADPKQKVFHMALKWQLF